jgi:hypothetical protein
LRDFGRQHSRANSINGRSKVASLSYERGDSLSVGWQDWHDASMLAFAVGAYPFDPRRRRGWNMLGQNSGDPAAAFDFMPV